MIICIHSPVNAGSSFVYKMVRMHKEVESYHIVRNEQNFGRKQFQEWAEKRDYVAIKTHIRERDWCYQIADLVVIPIRAPLLSMIGHLKKFDGRYDRIAKCFDQYKHLTEYEGIVIPVDLADRESARRVFKEMGVKLTAEVEKYIKAWKKENFQRYDGELEQLKYCIENGIYSELVKKKLDVMIYALRQTDLEGYYKKQGYKNLIWFGDFS